MPPTVDALRSLPQDACPILATSLPCLRRQPLQYNNASGEKLNLQPPPLTLLSAKESLPKAGRSANCGIACPDTPEASSRSLTGLRRMFGHFTQWSVSVG